MSRRNNTSNNNQSFRDMASKQSKPTSGYYLSDGVRNFLLFVFGWQALSGLFLTTGWDQLFDAFPNFKFLLGVLVVIMPLIAIIFIMILYDREG